MKDTLRNKCDLFADNYNVLNKKFRLNYSTNTRLGALLYSMDGRAVDTDAINRCHKVIKQNTGVFSQFKDTTNFMTSVMLSLHTEPEAILKGAVKIYETMRKEGFHSSPYLVLAAISIALQADPYNYHRIIYSTKDFYNAMKEEHWFITGSDDYGFSALLAMTNKAVSETIREIEKSYNLLKESFSRSNTVQSLSHVLAFSEEDTLVKCSRVIDLHEALKRRNCKFGTGVELSFLGVISLLDEGTEKLADEIAETNEYLKSKKGFNYWSVSAKERIMYSIALVCDDYLEYAKKNTVEMALANNVAGIVLAQQMATIAAVSGASAAAAASY